MIFMTKYVASQTLSGAILFVSLISLTAIATSMHLGTFNYFINKINYNESHQHNIIFIGTIVFLELRNIEYIIRKSESKTTYAFHVNWDHSDPELEQLRAIFCSLCIHNFKGITPTRSTRWEIQNDWEAQITSPITTKQKKKLWKEQTLTLQADYKNNRKLVQSLHKIIQKNVECDEIFNAIKNEVHKNIN